MVINAGAEGQDPRRLIKLRVEARDKTRAVGKVQLDGRDGIPMRNCHRRCCLPAAVVSLIYPPTVERGIRVRLYRSSGFACVLRNDRA